MPGAKGRIWGRGTLVTANLRCRLLGLLSAHCNRQGAALYTGKTAGGDEESTGRFLLWWLIDDESEGDGIELQKLAGTSRGGSDVDGDGISSGGCAEFEIRAGGGAVVVAVGGGHDLDVGGAGQRERRGIDGRGSGGRGTVDGVVEGGARDTVGDGNGLRRSERAAGRLNRRRSDGGNGGRGLRGTAASATAADTREDEKERKNGGGCGMESMRE